MTHSARRAMTAVTLWAALSPGLARARPTRRTGRCTTATSSARATTAAETAIGRDNAGRLEEKWRFPAEGSGLEIGVIHATPVVVDGYVYFGTATDPAFYKLTPDGKVRWSYRNPARAGAGRARRCRAESRNARFQSSAGGHLRLGAGHRRHRLLRRHRRLDLRAGPGDRGGALEARHAGRGVPRRPPINVFFASPILADGKLIVAGGTLEQVVAAIPGYRAAPAGASSWRWSRRPAGSPGSTTSAPSPSRSTRRSRSRIAGASTSSTSARRRARVWSTPSFDAESGTIFFGTDVNTAPRRPTADDPRLDTRESCAVIALDVRDGTERWVTQINPGDVWTNAMRSYDPKEGRYKDQSIGDTPKVYTIPVEGKPTKVVGVGCKNGGFYVLRADDGRIVAHTPDLHRPADVPARAGAGPADARPAELHRRPADRLRDRRRRRSSPTASTPSGSARRRRRPPSAVPPTGGRVVALEPRTRGRSAGGTSGPGSPRSAGRRRSPCTPTSATRSPRGSPSPTASSTSRRSPAASWSPSTPPRARCSRRSTSGRSGRARRCPAAASTSARATRCSTRRTSRPSSRRSTPAPCYSFGLPGEDEVSRLGAGDE